MGRKEGSGEEGDQRASKGVVAGGREEEETWFAQPHLVVLVGGDGDEGGLGEDVGAEGGVLGAEAVVLVRLHDVQPGLVLVHGVEDDLGMGRRRGHLMGMEGGHDAARPPARRQGEEKERDQQTLPKKFFSSSKASPLQPPPSAWILLVLGASLPRKAAPLQPKEPIRGFLFLPPSFPASSTLLWLQDKLGPYLLPPCSPGLCCCVSPPRNPNTRFHSQRGAVPTPAAPTSTAQASQPPSPVTLQDMGKEAGGG